MQFISVRDLRSKSAQIWRQLPGEKDMIITSNGKPIAILSTVPEDKIEQSLADIRRARAMSAVESMQSQSIAAGADRMTQDEINLEITAVRKERSR
jgi:antitoxin (DNA-binding transcriptional repressor) of toxin-antitoxin stability system